MKTKKKIVFISLILMILVNACIPSLHPLYTEEDLILDNRIVGTWVSDESTEDESIWKIEKYRGCGECPGPAELYPENLDGKLYRLEHIQSSDTITFDLYLLKLGDYLYFDFYPHEYESENDMRNMHLYPVHTFAKVDIKQNSIVIKQFSIDYLEELIEQNKIKISHEKSGMNIILTASTLELQKFVKKYADDENIFVEPTILKRKI